MVHERQVTSTGIPNLDRVLGGGLPRRQSIVVTGNPGSGKTILCSQVAFRQARAGHRSVVASITSESHDNLLASLRGFSFFDEAHVGEEVYFVSAYPWLKKGPKEARELLLNLVLSRRASTLFIDGLRALRDLWRDEAKLREFLHELSVGLATADCNGIFSVEYDAATLLGYPEATTVDGIVAIGVTSHGARRLRRIEVIKLRGRPHLPGGHPVRIDDDGVHITPRLETVTTSDADFVPGEGRAGFGVPQLDALLEGGLPRESHTLLIGNTGIGKTLLALHFAACGARTNERALFVSFFEPPGSLVARAANVGLDVAPLVRSGDLVIDYHPPLDPDADEMAGRILEQLERLDARRLVIDGLGELERALLDPHRTREFLTALMIRLRQLRVTAVYCQELTKLAGEVDLGDTPLSLIAENLLFARHMELRGTMRRFLSILKMRASAFDPALREFQIGKDGLRVLAPVRQVQGVITGVPHFVPAGVADDDAVVSP